MTRFGTFRNGSYHKQVTWGRRTIKDGECCSVWDVNGRHEIIMGPQRRYFWRTQIRFLDRHFADHHQYLVIKFRDGRKEHSRGPVWLFEDPTVHDSVAVHDAIVVDGFEMIVVYREEESGVKRRVIKGPVLFVPEAFEWVQTFTWHGPDPKNKASVAPGASQFQKLRSIAEQLYYNVASVRTADDAQVTVKLMIFFEIINVEVMLDTTNDPVGDFINATCADVITWASQKSYDEFLSKTNELNSLDTFPSLSSRADHVGFRIHKVVYRGYTASEALQEMHDQAIRKHTQLRLESEAASQKQSVADLELRRTMEREAQESEMATSRLHHELSLKTKKHELAMKEKQVEADFAAAQLAAERAAQLTFLDGLQERGVDLTKYLLAQMNRPDRVIRVEGSDGGESAAALHLHGQC